MISNHLSYLDIIVFSALQPAIFVTKSDVAGWPLFGWLARSAGSIFVDRTRRSDAARGLAEINQALQQDLLVVLFPEGTSSDGNDVLPFKSALLEPAAQANCPLHGATIGYSLDQGSAREEICYWGEMTLLPHLWNLLRKRGLRATVRFFEDDGETRDRKQLALRLRRQCQSELAGLPRMDSNHE